MFMKKKEEGSIDEDMFEFIGSIFNEKEIVFSEKSESHGEPDREIELEITYKDLIFITNIKKRTVKKTVALMFDITAKDKNVEIKDDRITEFKVEIKNIFLDYFDECYWIYDEQSLGYSQDVYLGINKAENLFRSYLINFMMLHYGIDWWEKVSKTVKNKKNNRVDGYQSALTDLHGVNLDLFSIDIDDLTSLVENEYTINIEIKCSSNQEIPTDNKELKKIAKRYVAQCSDDNFSVLCKTIRSFWNDELSKHFIDNCKFKEKWDRLCKNRNHIAHNKLIDKNMYKVMIFDNDYVIKELSDAIDRLRKSVKTEEDIQFHNYIYNQAIESDLSCFDSKIYDQNDIENEFGDYIQENILDVAEDMLYFCEALQDSGIYDIDFTNKGTLIEATGFAGEEFRLDIVESYFEEEEGGQSYITFELFEAGTEDRFSLTFYNTVAEMDRDTKQYVVVSEGGIDDSEFANYDKKTGYSNVVIEALTNFINQQPSNSAIEKMNSD